MSILPTTFSIAINGASLHPDYATPNETVDKMEIEGQHDERRALLERKNSARQSPYPTLIIEVKGEPKSDEVEEKKIMDERVGLVGALDDSVKKLELIFAMSAAIHKRENKRDDFFYDNIGQVSLQLILYESYVSTSLLIQNVYFLLGRLMGLKKWLL